MKILFNSDFANGDITQGGVLSKSYNDKSVAGVPGAQIVTPDPKLFGTTFNKRGLLFTLHKDDAPVASSKRAEVFTPRSLPLCSEFNCVEFTTIFPAGYASDTLSELFFQLAGNDFNLLNPNLAIWNTGNRFRLNWKYTNSAGTNIESGVNLPVTFQTARPYKWKIVFKRGLNTATGLTQIYLDGKLLHERKGQNCNIVNGAAETSQFLKFGIYKWPWMKTFTKNIVVRQVFHSDIIISTI